MLFIRANQVQDITNYLMCIIIMWIHLQKIRYQSDSVSATLLKLCLAVTAL